MRTPRRRQLSDIALAREAARRLDGNFGDQNAVRGDDVSLGVTYAIHPDALRVDRAGSATELWEFVHHADQDVRCEAASSVWLTEVQLVELAKDRSWMVRFAAASRATPDVLDALSDDPDMRVQSELMRSPYWSQSRHSERPGMRQMASFLHADAAHAA